MNRHWGSKGGWDLESRVTQDNNPTTETLCAWTEAT